MVAKSASPKKQAPTTVAGPEELKKIRAELLAKGCTGPWPMFTAEDIKPIQEMIYDHMKEWLEGDTKGLTLVEKLRLPVRKDTPQSVGLALRKKMWPEVEKFAATHPRVRQVFEVLLDSKVCEPCSTFQDFRGNLPVRGQPLTGWHQDNETFFVLGRKEWRHPNFTMWISLNGAEENNAMELLPGSHTSGKLYAQHYGNTQRTLEEIDGELAKIKPLRFSAQPGEAYFLTPMTFHRSVPNGQDYARFSMDMRFFAPDVRTRYSVAPWLYWKKFDTLVRQNGVYQKVASNPAVRRVLGMKAR